MKVMGIPNKYKSWSESNLDIEGPSIGVRKHEKITLKTKGRHLGRSLQFLLNLRDTAQKG
jgi:hypothetical protein